MASDGLGPKWHPGPVLMQPEAQASVVDEPSWIYPLVLCHFARTKLPWQGEKG